MQEFRNRAPSDISSSESPEYRLIVQANNYAVEIDNDILMVHKVCLALALLHFRAEPSLFQFAKDHYATRFAELEQFAIQPLDYCRAVQRIGNPEDLTGLQDRMQGVLPSATLMAVAVTATDNTGHQLTDKDWAATNAACDLCFELDQSKADILTYVESRMNRLAPNLSAIVGPRTATKLLGVAGGLQALSRQPSCNIHLFGAQKKQAALGLSTGAYGSQRKHIGFIYQSDLVQSVPEEYRGKAQRTVSAKCALAIRMDAGRSNQDGSFGFKALEELHKKLEKLAEPPPKKVTKALPKPNEGPSKKRGGKRARKEKEAYQMTELRKMQNRVKFGEEELEDGAYDETRGLGMIGASSGKLRANLGEDRSKGESFFITLDVSFFVLIKTRTAKLSKAHKNRLATLKGSSTPGGSVSGMASSLAFTPAQGMELIDPAAQKRKVEAANDSWFKNDSGGTFSVMPGKK